MLCPNCQRENEPTARFCIFCGSSLPMPGDADNIEGQAGAVEEEIRQLRQLIARITDRLDVLERGRGVTKPIPQPAPPISASTPPPQAAPAAIPIPAAEAPPPKERPPKVREREWEQILGGSWLARIGVLALIVGIAFFLKFAFDNDWIGPTGRIILGIVAGLVMLGLGYYWQKK
jgi:uncharacterized membrane protein